MRHVFVSIFLSLVVIHSGISFGQAKKKAPASKVPRGSGSVDWGPVAKVNAETRIAVRESAKKIDGLIEAAYRKNGITPNPTLKDSLFCRRAYLEIAGRVPLLQEIGKFVQSKNPRRRELLIDELLSSHDYVSHTYNYWADILRLQDHPINNNQLAQPYHEWIKDSIRENKPYDDWVREMLTAEGRIWENPAVGFVMRDANMELDAVDNMVQVFLGTQIGCAQCHDHPFDKWTQREYYEMAAYWFGTRTRANAGDRKRFTKGNPLGRLRAELKKMDPDANTGGTFSRVINANLFEVWEQKRALKLPHDYQYDNGKPHQVVSMKPIFGDTEDVVNGKSPRRILADWMTSRENPRFATNIVNRLWQKAFGIALIEPANNIRDDSEAMNPEVLDFLTAELIRLNFDVRELQRIIFNTRTWQREATSKDIDLSTPYYFPGPALRRMSAEQIWDSLITLAVYNPKSFTRPSMDNVAQTINMDLNKVSASDVLKIADDFNGKFSAGAQRKTTRERNSYKGMTLARASELPTPLPSDHFLRQFGQSDRELMETSSRDGSVSQVLTMFNGEITHMMLEKGSVIFDTVMRAPSVTDRINGVFYSVLCRAPRKNEADVAREEIKTAGNAGYGNVIWALINTKEFLFIQ
ncbi:MAG: DUF1549 domain-containing protein [Fuerstiella sp.]|jgi:hypothetical protein|nr:DUF1549 domain-containing protein [Fuerstiella sp.]MCP4513436.1 DUF1549 domain-containing protein [Fuerstiella sp.]MDG2130107.1 DUF1549 domain-containing protein [Fuerstiella sp.]